jgi:hypothetical protein
LTGERFFNAGAAEKTKGLALPLAATELAFMICGVGALPSRSSFMVCTATRISFGREDADLLLNKPILFYFIGEKKRRSICLSSYYTSLSFFAKESAGHPTFFPSDAR